MFHMEESFYHELADKELAKLLEFAELLEESSNLEAELDSGVLTLTMPNKRQFVINKHTPSRQIWVSSPVSGAGYFEYEEGKWLPKRRNTDINKDLFLFIKDELHKLLAN
jgi:frataxin